MSFFTTCFHWPHQNLIQIMCIQTIESWCDSHFQFQLNVWSFTQYTSVHNKTWMIRLCRHIPLMSSPTTTVQISVAREQRNAMPMPTAIVTNTHVFFASEQTRAQKNLYKGTSQSLLVSIIFVIHLRNIHDNDDTVTNINVPAHSLLTQESMGMGIAFAILKEMRITLREWE